MVLSLSRLPFAVLVNTLRVQASPLVERCAANGACYGGAMLTQYTTTVVLAAREAPSVIACNSHSINPGYEPLLPTVPACASDKEIGLSRLMWRASKREYFIQKHCNLT